MTVQSTTTGPESKCSSCPARQSGICGAADCGAIAELDRHSHLKHFGRGQIIFPPDADTSFITIVVSGVVKMVCNGVDGTEKIVGLLYPSAFCGRMTRERLGFSYEAATETIMCCIDRAAFNDILSRNPAVKSRLLKATMDELDLMRAWVALTSGRTTLQRLATFLAIFARRADQQAGCADGPQGGGLVQLLLDRRDMAEVLGTTAETLSRNFQILARRNVIETCGPNMFRVLDRARLVAESGETASNIDRIAGMRPHVDPNKIRNLCQPA